MLILFRTLILSIALLSLPISVCLAQPLNQPVAQQLPDWKQPDYILQAFKEIALKNEYKKTNGAILKWQTPIRYEFIYHGLKQNLLVEELFNAHLQQLSQITGLVIEPSQESANLKIHLTPDRLYEEVIKQHTLSKVTGLHTESHCMGSLKTRNKGEIYQAEIVIPVDHVFSRGLLVSCIIEESTQILGLPNDSDWVYPSIANDKSKIEFLTGLDYLFLKILYSKNIKAGMRGKPLEQKLKNRIQALHLAGEVEMADEKVKAVGLYPLTN